MSKWEKLKVFSKNGSSEEMQPILNETSLEVESGSSVSVNISPDSSSKVKKFGSFDDMDKLKYDQQKIRNCFDDGVTKIDFVIVYEEQHKDLLNESDQGKSDEEKANKQKQKNWEYQHQKWRNKFIKNLRREGMLIEIDKNSGEETTVYYFKLSCSWDLLVYYAEHLNLRAPLQLREYKQHVWSSRILKKLKIPNCMDQDVPNPPSLYFTCTFKNSKLQNFLGSSDHETYFSNTERARIAWEILQNTVYGKKKRAELGIERLLSENVFSAAFPLHDGDFKITDPVQDVDPTLLNLRQVLRKYWARWGVWYKYQPLDHIRSYFGEKIGIYFAWLGFYTSWLLPVSILGLIVFIVGAALIETNTPANEVCSSGKKFVMCPRCDGCRMWYLSSTCLMTKLAYLFDNGGTVFFAVVMSFWAVFFLEFWKRKNAQLAHHWEVMDFEAEEERPRPEYNARAPTMALNPVTGVMEPHFPPGQRLRRIFTGFTILIIMLGVVIIFVLSVIVYKAIIGLVMIESKDKLVQGQASNLRTFSGAVINLILIMLMANIYTVVAEILTKWEMHRTQTQYEDSLTFKVFVFQFVNYYSSIFYIAFFKGKFVGYPGHYDTTFGIRNDGCGSGGCLIELAQQLLVIMVGKQAINNIEELVVPWLKKKWQKRKMKRVFLSDGQQNLTKPWEIEYHELVEFQGLFHEYLEMVLQFGFITIFVAAFPIAPLFALLNNWIEIRLDARKMVCETRRPIAERAQDIGVWYEILDALVQIAVVTNAFLIAFTSQFIPRLFYEYRVGNDTLNGFTNFSLSYAPNNTEFKSCRYYAHRTVDGQYTQYYYELLVCKLAFVIVFEHVVFFISRMIDWSVPDIPESLMVKVKRERYLAKQALTDNIDTSMTEVFKLYTHDPTVIVRHHPSSQATSSKKPPLHQDSKTTSENVESSSSNVLNVIPEEDTTPSDDVATPTDQPAGPLSKMHEVYRPFELSDQSHNSVQEEPHTSKETTDTEQTTTAPASEELVPKLEDDTPSDKQHSVQIVTQPQFFKPSGSPNSDAKLARRQRLAVRRSKQKRDQSK
ncbi:anoctamin-7-like isoform X1 [Clavelina lepadiformis]|uniref:anoctamin-7-like isoform X1 n=1 Tax=Clavelina lepadiformis TaxID=159417 RepID=UPI0040413206